MIEKIDDKTVIAQIYREMFNCYLIEKRSSGETRQVKESIDEADQNHQSVGII